MASRLLSNSKVMVLGGGGLVGQAIARRLAMLPIRPALIVLASRTREEAFDAVEGMRMEQDEREKYMPRLRSQPKLNFVPEWGDIFVRHSLAHLPRVELEQHPSRRSELLEDIYGDLQSAYDGSHLVYLMRKHRPNILVDAINTATGLSYKNTFDAAAKVQQALASLPQGNAGNFLAKSAEDLLLSNSVPNLTRHVSILAKAANEIKTIEQYIKIGTTGTGGMGFNLPFSHSECQPSHLILAKNEVAFAHTGLLFLWSRTPGSPSIREIKRTYGNWEGFRLVESQNAILTCTTHVSSVSQPQLVLDTKIFPYTLYMTAMVTMSCENLGWSLPCWKVRNEVSMLGSPWIILHPCSR